MTKIAFLYITNPSPSVAKKIAKFLLKEKLIACANIYPKVKSLYYWRGKLVEETEVILIAKTVPKKYRDIVKLVEKIHPYSTPCIIKLTVEANKKYSAWLKKQIQ
ncbi:divalent-cation tolerance protein CutA [Candidatus Parcubacteria bacterium]|jgi:periplasmic divalent cation tolerance protein|nr:MAG: divalent-cation tolerance protein CutA [Candidatus Parcubacteria bacterium]